MPFCVSLSYLLLLFCSGFYLALDRQESDVSVLELSSKSKGSNASLVASPIATLGIIKKTTSFSGGNRRPSTSAVEKGAGQGVRVLEVGTRMNVMVSASQNPSAASAVQLPLHRALTIIKEVQEFLRTLS